jgi:hypothetical protein
MKTKFKVGDIVRIRPDISKEDIEKYDTIGPGWNPYMNETIGMTGIILNVNNKVAVRVEFDIPVEFKNWNYRIEDLQSISEVRLEKLESLC